MIGRVFSNEPLTPIT